METNYKISTETFDNVPILNIEGDMTSEADADVMQAYEKLKPQCLGKRLIINFEKTHYINSSGIATLINIIQDLAESSGKIAFVGLSNHFQKVMDIVGITDFIDIHSTNKEAISDTKK